MVRFRMSEASSLPPDDPAKLRAMIAALEAENAAMRAETTRLTAVLKAHEALVQALQIRIAKLQRQKFGASSEKIEREIEQLELQHTSRQAARPAHPEHSSRLPGHSHGFLPHPKRLF